VSPDYTRGLQVLGAMSAATIVAQGGGVLFRVDARGPWTAAHPWDVARLGAWFRDRPAPEDAPVLFEGWEAERNRPDSTAWAGPGAADSLLAALGWRR